MKWEGSLVDGAGATLEEAKGSMRIEDVSPTTLDDLQVEFTCASGGELRESMRQGGVAHLRALIERTMNELQEEVRLERAAADAQSDGATTQQQHLRPAATPAVPPPKPVPLAPAAAAAAATAGAPARPPPAARAATPAAADDDASSPDAPPPPLAAALRRLRTEPEQVRELRLSCSGIGDVHIRPLMEALSQTRCALTRLDLAFNRITDAGVHVLCRAIAGGAALELTHLHLGGNRVSVNGMALSQGLKQCRESVLVDWKPQLRDAVSMCTVGTVYADSPAAKASLRSGDSIVAFGPLQHREFKSVSDSIVPIVKGAVGKEIDVVVVRLDEAAKMHQLVVTLVPRTWSGGGLLGCILR